MRRPRPSQRDPLRSPAVVVIASYTRHLLRATDAAVGRLADAHDLEALHDSRVCLRRLRGWLQAFDSQFHLKRRRRHALRRLAQATNPARDAEVCIQWLARLRTQLEPHVQPGVTGFLSYLTALRDTNYRRIRKELPPAWNKLLRRLQHTASAVKDSGHAHVIFVQAYSASLREYATDFSAALERARLSPDATRIHRVRIATKKLRYLLESTLRGQTQAKGLAKELKALHENAGAIQDLQRFQALTQQAFLHQAGRRYRRLSVMYADVGADHRTLKHPDLTPGLLPLLWIGRAACIKQAEYIIRFRKDYLSRKRPVCLTHLREFMTQLTHPAQTT